MKFKKYLPCYFRQPLKTFLWTSVDANQTCYIKKHVFLLENCTLTKSTYRLASYLQHPATDSQPVFLPE